MLESSKNLYGDPVSGVFSLLPLFMCKLCVLWSFKAHRVVFAILRTSICLGNQSAVCVESSM